MGLLDAVNSATTAVSGAINSVKSLTDINPASALSGAGLSSLLQSLGGAKLPLPNPLSKYATYSYVLSISAMSDNDINFPDLSYMAGKSLPLICKSANADPYNRVATAYGKFDFFVDSLTLSSTLGFEKNNNTNVTGIQFSIIEPFSMGMFIIACQTAAYQQGWKNYKDAPFLLTVSFRGNTQGGSPQLVPNSTRYIPFKFSMLNMKVSEKGATYNITAIPYNQQALSTRTAKFKSDVSIKGATVQELLQTGPKSLQSVINQRMQQYVKDGTVKVPDQVLILFPTDTASSAVPAGTSDNKETKSSATVNTKTESGSGDSALFVKLGVAKSKINETLVQPDGDCNALGKASMGFGLDKKGDPSIGSESEVWDPKNKVWVRANNALKIKEGDFRFTQDTDAINAINQVLLASNYPTETLDQNKVDSKGMRQWWTIDTQVYPISSDENITTTGQKPRLIVYRVIPYAVSVAATNPPNTPPPGVTSLKKQVVKEYNYLYTGKNTEVLKFDIEFNASFQAMMASDNLKRSMDVKNGAASGDAAKDKNDTLKAQPEGSPVLPVPGVTPTSVSYTGTITSTDKLGGGGSETQETRAARLFHDAITRGKDMVLLNMEIWGDPYYVAQSGLGNYTSKSTSYDNLNADGTVNYQNGEVYITVNFRTPIDINQSTGLYKFAGSSSAPVTQFSGLYRVRRVTSTFAGGMFKQVLTGSRLDQQENPSIGTANQTFTTSNKTIDPKDPNGYGEG